MKEIDEKLEKTTNFGCDVNFDEKIAIIKETLAYNPHSMIMSGVCQDFNWQFEDFSLFEIADLIDFWEIEKSYGRLYQKR